MTEAQRSLIELPRSLAGDEAQLLIQTLTETWVLTVGAEPEDLEGDLAKCRRWFDPVAQGQRLRRELGELSTLPTDLDDPGEPFVLTIASHQRLVTPEGRCALELLRQFAVPDQETVTVPDAELVVYDRLLARTYRYWSRHRLNSVIQLLAGTTKPLQIPAAGVVLALLIDRCTSEDRALVRYSSESERNIVDQAFFNAVNAFSDVLAPSRRRGRAQHLISGWMLYEARRRLGDNLVVIEARGGSDGKVWVREDAEDEVIAVVARDLVRGHRARPSAEQFEEAYDGLVAALRSELPRLAGFGLAHERPPNTRRLRERLLAAIRRYIDEGGDVTSSVAV